MRVMIRVQDNLNRLTLFRISQVVKVRRGRDTSRMGVQRVRKRFILQREEIMSGIIKRKGIEKLHPLSMVYVKSLGEICIGTGYQPPRRPNIPIQNLLRILRRTTPAYLLGDLNARHRIFGHNNNNNAGDILYNEISSGGAIHLGPDFQTFLTPRAGGTPDTVIANNNQIHNIYISPGPITTSDHLPIIMKISASPIQIPTEPTYKLNKANWTGFKNELQQSQPINLDHCHKNSITIELNNWFNKTELAMNRYIPLQSHKTIRQLPESIEIQTIKAQYNQLLQEVRPDAWTPLQRTRLKALQINLRNICKEERDKRWEDMIMNTEANYREPEKFCRKVKNLIGSTKQKIPYILNNEGRKLFTDSEKEQEFRKYWEKIFMITDEENQQYDQQTENMVRAYMNTNEHLHKEHETIDLTRLDPTNPLTKPIKYEHVANTINKIKRNKAPGHSKINKTVLQQMPKIMIKNLTHILNAALSVGIFPEKFKEAILKLIPKPSKPTTFVKNFRPISLLEVIGKIFEKLINSRLIYFLENNNKYDPRQQSYRKHRGTNTAIALIYETIATSQQDRQMCNVVLRDLSNAFDKIWHLGLKYKITKLGLPRIFTSLLCNFLDNRSVKIKINTFIGPKINLQSGVPQGSSLSPTLFNIYTADTPTPTQSTYHSYADDVTQIIRQPGKSKAMLKRKTERAITELNNYEKQWKIKTNPTKFQILHISKINPPPIEINGINIPYARDSKILGLKMSRNGITGHIKDKIKTARATLTKLKRFSKLSPKVKIHLYKALVLPHIEYPPVPLNSITHSNKYKLQSIQNKAIRWANGDRPPYTTTIEELHHRYKLEPINIRNFKQAYNIWEKLRIHQEEELIKITNEEVRGTHSWWPLSYIDFNDQMPEPLVIKRRQVINRNEDEDSN